MTLPYPAEALLERAVRNVSPRLNRQTPRWVCVMDTFGLGSTDANQLCQHYGLDPDELVTPPPRTRR